MDHVVYIDIKENDLEKLINGTKRMILRGETIRKLPYGRVQPGDRLFFIPNDGTSWVHACANVKMVWDSKPLSPKESRQIIEDNQEQLQLSPIQLQRWSGKRFLVLIVLSRVTALIPFLIDQSGFGNMDDWFPVGDIEQVKLENRPVLTS